MCCKGKVFICNAQTFGAFFEKWGGSLLLHGVNAENELFGGNKLESLLDVRKDCVYLQLEVNVNALHCCQPKRRITTTLLHETRTVAGMCADRFACGGSTKEGDGAPFSI